MKKEQIIEEDFGYNADHIPSITHDSLSNQRIETIESSMLDRNMLPDEMIDYAHPLKLLVRGVQQDGYSLRWERFKVEGMINLDTVQESSMNGWKLVPKERAVHLIQWDEFGSDAFASKYIVYKDVVLMEIPTELFNKRQRWLDKKSYDRMQSLEGVIQDMPEFGRQLNRLENF